MNPTLTKIKRLIIQGKYIFTGKADAERIAGLLTQEMVLESILNASFVRTKRSRSEWRQERHEKMHTIESFTYDGILIYTKGVIRQQGGAGLFTSSSRQRNPRLEIDHEFQSVPFVRLVRHPKKAWPLSFRRKRQARDLARNPVLGVSGLRRNFL